ncbi:MAG: hypothetical protein IIB85_05270 [Chloroflexi bacterium]|nr:hypothetical protein [Chloroflexota bacterium]
MEEDEARSLLAVITSYVLDNSGVSQDAKARVRQWRTDHAEGTVKMAALTDGMNDAVGAYIDARTDRQVRARGRYGRVRSQK